jgi:hypothetical protein
MKSITIVIVMIFWTRMIQRRQGTTVHADADVALTAMVTWIKLDPIFGPCCALMHL